jgi:hypothetical protein
MGTNGNSCERLVPTKEYCSGSLVGTNGNSCERLVPIKEYCTGSLVGTNGNSCERLVSMKQYCSGCSHSSVPVEAIPKRLKQLGVAACTNEILWCAVPCWYQWKLFQRDLYQWCWEAFMMLIEQPIRAYGSLGLMPIVEHHAKLLPRKYQKSGYLL